MSFWDKVIKNVRLNNAEASAIHEIGVEDMMEGTNDASVNWDDKIPKLVIPSIKNLRRCVDDTEIVNGIIEDLVIKSISGWVLEGNNAEALKYIEEEAKRLNLSNIFHETARNNIIDGAMYYDKVVQNGKAFLRELAFDGENYSIKEIYDDETGSEIIGYVQKVLKNKNTNKGWLKKQFDELNEEMEYKEYYFEPNKVIATHFFTKHGIHRGLVENVLDSSYMLNQLLRMMPQIVYKQSNIMILQKDSETAGVIKLAKNFIKKAVKALSNYHKKGVVYLPDGLKIEMIGDNKLPDIPAYITKMEKHIFMGLSTPPSVFDGSSSNRSTAVVQLDSDKSGRVLLQQFLQHKLFLFAQEIINWLLSLRGYPADCVWVNFNPTTDEDGDITTENGTKSTSKPGDGLNITNIENGVDRSVEVSA